MSADLYADIKTLYPSLTRAEKNIADALLSNGKNMVYMTISEIAAFCNVGETSVFRFCRQLGKSGYKAFKVDLARAVSDAEGEAQRDDCIVSTQDNLDTMIRKVLNNNISILNETYHLLDPAGLSQATQWLTQAQHICFFGVGYSASSAWGACNLFTSFCAKAEYVSDSKMQCMRAALMTSGDVAVIFSYTGATREILAIAKAVKGSGAKLISITRFSRSPLAVMSDLILSCGGNEGPLQSGDFSLKTTQLFLIEVLSIAYCQANAAESKISRSRIASALADSRG